MDKTRLELALRDYKLRVVKRVIEITHPNLESCDPTVDDLDLPYDVVYQKQLEINIGQNDKRKKTAAISEGRKQDNAVHSGRANSGHVSMISRVWGGLKRLFSKLMRSAS